MDYQRECARHAPTIGKHTDMNDLDANIGVRKLPMDASTSNVSLAKDTQELTSLNTFVLV